MDGSSQRLYIGLAWLVYRKVDGMFIGLSWFRPKLGDGFLYIHLYYLDSYRYIFILTKFISKAPSACH